jgi:hypothetical protein
MKSYPIKDNDRRALFIDLIFLCFNLQLTSPVSRQPGQPVITFDSLQMALTLHQDIGIQVHL